MPCQNLVQQIVNTSQIDVISNYYTSSRAPINLVVVVTSSQKILTKKPLPFIETKFLQSVNGTLVMSTYSALKDKRWWRLKVVYVQYPPFVYKNVEGKITGSRYEAWAIIGHRLGFTMDFKVKKSYADMFKHLTNASADLALPASTFNAHTLKVTTCKFRMTPLAFHFTLQKSIKLKQIELHNKTYFTYIFKVFGKLFWDLLVLHIVK